MLKNCTMCRADADPKVHVTPAFSFKMKSYFVLNKVILKKARRLRKIKTILVCDVGRFWSTYLGTIRTAPWP